MTFDLNRIKLDVDAAPIEPPYALDLAIAVLADLFREARLAPPPDASWAPLLARGSQPANRPGQIAALARLVAISALRPASVAALAARAPKDPAAVVEGFLETIAPVTAELVAENPFRREEVVRRWIEALGGAIAG